MTYKIVDSECLDNDLTMIAEAIRLKTFNQATLAFPAGFISAINSIKGSAMEGIDSAEAMTALLVEENVGNMYKYLGDTTDDYVNGDIYIVEQE